MRIKYKRILKGLLRSWSANMSLVAVALGGLEQYKGTISGLIGPDNTGILLMAAGILGLILRAKTNESLEEKGAK